MTGWEKKRILIWGKTRPELSSKYRELVCTGGLFADSGRLVRLYPIPLRFMDEEKIFAKYNWIDAFVAKNTADARPESYRIRDDSITVVGKIPAKRTWEERAKWILQDRNLVKSVEDLQGRQLCDGTSLGIVKPKSIDGFSFSPTTQAERDEFTKKYEAVTRQTAFPLEWASGREIHPLRPPDFRFKIRFTCDDPQCSGHEFSILDWEVDALYFKLLISSSKEEAAKKTNAKIMKNFSDGRDRRFFLGNIASRPTTFTIVGLWYPMGTGKQQMWFDFSF